MTLPTDDVVTDGNDSEAVLNNAPRAAPLAFPAVPKVVE